MGFLLYIQIDSKQCNTLTFLLLLENIYYTQLIIFYEEKFFAQKLIENFCKKRESVFGGCSQINAEIKRQFGVTMRPFDLTDRKCTRSTNGIGSGIEAVSPSIDLEIAIVLMRELIHFGTPRLYSLPPSIDIRGWLSASCGKYLNLQ